MPYEEIKEVKTSIGGTLVLYPVKGKRRIFMNIKGHTVKELQQFIMDARKLTDKTAEPSESHQSLCPSCFVPLSQGLDSCPQCMAPFKRPRKAVFRSLLLPGLGDIYLGHRGLGILELLGSAVVWLLVLTFLFSGESVAVFSAVFLLLIYNGLDGLLTYHMAKKGYMLDKKKRGVMIYLLIGIPSLLVLAFIILCVLASFGPDTEVVPGKQLEAKYLSGMRELGVLHNDEQVMYWYSDALFDFRSGFYFFTNKKVVVYSNEFEAPAIIVPYSDIVDIDFVENPSWIEDSQITLYCSDGSSVFFPVSSDNGGDKKFHDLLVSTWHRERGR
jgi:hypothetical protein